MMIGHVFDSLESRPEQSEMLKRQIEYDGSLSNRAVSLRGKVRALAKRKLISLSEITS